MTTIYNERFKQFLTEYHLPDDLSFSIDVPIEIQNLLADKIVITDLGVTLQSFDSLYRATHDWENQSIIEDNENHFHVDWYIEPADNKKAFMLGVQTLMLLADKFQKEKVLGIRFWYSFQTPELGQLWAERNKCDDDDEGKHFISDRLSFYTVRNGESIISTHAIENKFWAILAIDV